MSNSKLGEKVFDEEGNHTGWTRVELKFQAARSMNVSSSTRSFRTAVEDFRSDVKYFKFLKAVSKAR